MRFLFTIYLSVPVTVYQIFSFALINNLHFKLKANDSFCNSWWMNCVEYKSNVPYQRIYNSMAMSGKSNNIRNRITSITNTRKITAAMNLIASAKVFRAQNAVRVAQPFSDNLQILVRNLINCLGDTKDIPLLYPRKKTKNITLCVITSDCGLCGGYNSCVIKLAEARYKNLRKFNDVDNVGMIIIGKKGVLHFERREYNIRTTYECNQNPCVKKSFSISDELLRTYLSGETDAVELIYTKFESIISSVPSVRTLLPIPALEILSKDCNVSTATYPKPVRNVKKTSHTDKDTNLWSSMNMIFEQDSNLIVQKIIPLYINGLVYSALCESIASELSSRMKSMQLASDNADDLLKYLNIEYNHARQTAVTQEILEVVSGAAALD